MKKILLMGLLLAPFLASAKEPTALGQGRYMLTDQNFTIFGSPDKIVAKLTRQAHEFCKQKTGNEAFLTDADGSDAVPGEINNSGVLKRGAQGATGTIRFRCELPEVVSSSSRRDIYSELPKLKALLDSGAITQAEYDDQKRKLLEQK